MSELPQTQQDFLSLAVFQLKMILLKKQAQDVSSSPARNKRIDVCPWLKIQIRKMSREQLLVGPVPLMNHYVWAKQKEKQPKG